MKIAEGRFLPFETGIWNFPLSARRVACVHPMELVSEGSMQGCPPPHLTPPTRARIRAATAAQLAA